ncbi:sugar transporter SWEET1 [Pseudomyrmex gracilis]|uniref:sugar transporter SWEET1 n=1 Tax=Pseudomyrmex gracilis TaxID=219809 RepID=UPI000994FF05|nr:sugar transporter SWEET1 [Pseudomyrmex gracilis]
MVLEDYKEIVGSSAAYTTILHMLSGTLICRDIYKKGTSEGFDPMPFLGGVGLCLLMLRYAWMVDDINMKVVNIFGFLVNIVYMAVYYYYTPNTRKLLKQVSKVSMFVTILLAYAQVEDPEVVEHRFGIVVTVLLLLLIASPLAHLREVIRTKSTEILPFPLIFMGTLVSFQWLLYGVIIDNSFLIFQNAVGFILSVSQLSLFAIFPSKREPKKID